jgi:hypothetical protein
VEDSMVTTKKRQPFGDDSSSSDGAMRRRRSLPRRNPPGEPTPTMVTPLTWRTTMTIAMTGVTTRMMTSSSMTHLIS